MTTSWLSPTGHNDWMKLSEGGIELVREVAVELLEHYVPFKAGDARYDEVCKDFGGKGTTCGFLCHWMLWRLGYRGADCNREEPEDGLRYRVGQNIAAIFNQGRPPFVPWSKSLVIEPGDIGYVYDGKDGKEHNPNSEHVFVFVRRKAGNIWVTADAGQLGNGAAMKEKVVSNRKYGDRYLVGIRRLADFELSQPCRMYYNDNPY